MHSLRSIVPLVVVSNKVKPAKDIHVLVIQFHSEFQVGLTKAFTPLNVARGHMYIIQSSASRGPSPCRFFLPVVSFARNVELIVVSFQLDNKTTH